MPQPSTVQALRGLVARLSEASWKERDPIKASLKQEAERDPDRDGVRTLLEALRRDIQDLEVRWEVDEVLEALAPPPAEPEPDDEEGDDPDKPLSAADLDLVYDDPRGFMLHRSKTGDRWFATQRDPRSGQPQTFELHATEVGQLKQQLTGSPYWVLGSGVTS